MKTNSPTPKKINLLACIMAELAGQEYAQRGDFSWDHHNPLFDIIYTMVDSEDTEVMSLILSQT